ncbi:MAG: PstS family phosphate ABC transporter substrate-binding protein [Paenibacillus dendritiformis]|uniref:PstS family phosphate ABC transporter substrate-binding protein n=1 Tax=Paenibacillus dendritiformis TaxID=130049 RepID=UPI0015603B68|nr:PstS family phosphate ABC transporter substrate-binding protein [Paenibacillus dendritiformis]MDU5143450.1 PstS family phosphate ABC transporter substrate-binding protein [Paenibacillus dendritiformis]NRF98893.1 PstS family phosphate ABC transporter substrate-binding protein [Paenibacillus dendritiformis]
MKKWGKQIMLLTLVAVMAFALAACGGKKEETSNAAGNSGTESTQTNTANNTENQGSEDKLSGTIEIDGSSTVYPMTEAIAEEFGKEHSAVRVSVGTSGTGGGFKRFIAGETAISNASRPIKDKEAEDAKANGIEYLELTVAYDGLSIVVNKDNTWVDKITLDELKKIYEPNSKVKTWADVREGWPNEEIKIYSPGADHGTFDYFTEEINGKAQESRNDGQITFSADTNAIVQGVAGDKNALGYFGYSFFEENQDKLKLVPVDNGTATVAPTLETIKDGSYSPLSRPLLIYVSKKHLEKPEVKAYVEYYLQTAGSIAEEVGYVPLPQEKYDEQLNQLK